MRLKNAPDYSMDSGGSTPEVVEQLLGAKRARPASSLDVKVSNGKNLTRPPKSEKPQANQQQHTSKDPIRPRGGSGIPRTKFDLSELEGLTEEEIMQALQDNPELAAAAAAAAERMRKSARVPPKEPLKRNSITGEHPPHLKAMMDEGVPIKQWIVLLVLLAAGLYQLRKAIVGSKSTPAVTVSAKKTDKQLARKAGKRKKAMAPTANKLRSAPVVHDTLTQVEEDLLVQEVPVAAPAKKGSTAQHSKKKSRKPKAKTEQHRATQNPAKETLSHESPDSVSTDGSSSTDAGGDDSVEVGGEVESNAVAKNGDNGWQTVGAVTASETPVSKEENNATPADVDEHKNGASTVYESKTDESTADEAVAVVNNSKKKKKKKGSPAVSEKSATEAVPHSDLPAADQVPAEINTFDDEALALQLQREEEKLVDHEVNQAASQNIWEEVCLKKKKK